MPGFCIATIGRVALAIPRVAVAIPTPIGAAAKILARSPVRGAARGELLVATEFPLRPIAAGAVVIARRPRAVGAIPLGTVGVLAETLAARGVGPLFAPTFARRVW